MTEDKEGKIYCDFNQIFVVSKNSRLEIINLNINKHTVELPVVRR